MKDVLANCYQSAEVKERLIMPSQGLISVRKASQWKYHLNVAWKKGRWDINSQN